MALEEKEAGRLDPPLGSSPSGGDLHPLILDAARGRLPGWATLSARRRAHAARVADLLDAWARELGLPERARARWRAVGFLHDALKGSEADELRIWAGADTPEPLLHGAAVAERLRRADVDDPPLLLAIAFHTTGHPRFDALGEYLYLADFLDPGRRFRRSRRSRLRDSLPEDRGPVLLEVVGLRLRHLLEDRRMIVKQTVEFWNRLAAEFGEEARG